MPLVAQEIPLAIKSLAIGFVQRDGQFNLAALLGLEVEKNELVDAEGKWLASYFPNYYKHHPFYTHVAEEDGELKNFICIDTESGLLVPKDSLTDQDLPLQADNDLETLFNDDKTPTDFLKDIVSSLQKYAAHHTKTLEACEQLQSLDLFCEYSANHQGQARTIRGLFQIDETKLNSLSANNLEALRDSGALMIAYGQLFSMPNIEPLLHARQLSKQHSASMADLSFDSSGASGSISFDNL